MMGNQTMNSSQVPIMAFGTILCPEEYTKFIVMISGPKEFKILVNSF